MRQADVDAVLSPEQDLRLRESIGRQALLTPGRVVLELSFHEDLCRQNGFVHAGAITTLADPACGYAAMSSAWRRVKSGERCGNRDSIAGVRNQP